MSKDLYSILGVARDVDADTLRSEFRKLARKLHPDLNPDDEAAEARFKEVSAAYGVLSDEKKRKLYDEFGDVALQAGFDEAKAEQMRRYGGGTPFDFGGWSQGFNAGGGIEELLGGLFGGRFGGRGGRRARAPRKGAVIEAELAIDLALSVRGGSTSIRLDLPGREHVEVKIPPGVRDGQALRLSGLGQPGQNGGPSGDLLVRLKVLDHPSYRREGDDLHVEVPITMAEAVRGAKISFQGPTGEISLTVPPNTQTGRRFRLRGLGAKDGNLYVRVILATPELPDPPTEEDEERLSRLADELSAFYPADVRAKVQF